MDVSAVNHYLKSVLEAYGIKVYLLRQIESRNIVIARAHVLQAVQNLVVTSF